MFKPSYNSENIDPLLLGVIDSLNANGFFTQACCQGRRTVEEFKIKKHCPAAYIFLYRVANVCPGVREAARAVGLYVYESDVGIGISSVYVCSAPAEPGDVVGYKLDRHSLLPGGKCIESWTPGAMQRVIDANEGFIDKVSKVFKCHNEVSL